MFYPSTSKFDCLYVIIDVQTHLWMFYSQRERERAKNMNNQLQLVAHWPSTLDRPQIHDT